MKRVALILLLTGIAGQVPAQQLREAPITPAFTPVTWERLVNAADEPENWLMYSATLDSQRHSRLDQINTGNVSQLEMKWAYQIPVIDRAETTPLAPTLAEVAQAASAAAVTSAGSILEADGSCFDIAGAS